MERLVKAAIAAAVLLLGADCAAAQPLEKARLKVDSVVLRLSDEEPEDLPADDFARLVSAAASASKAAGDKVDILIVTPSRVVAICAEVILHSYDIASVHIRRAATLSACAFPASRRVGLVGSLTAIEKRVLSARGIEPLPLPLPEPEPKRKLPKPKAQLSVAIVLGNEPLDESTPTIDMVKRALKAVEFAKANPGSLLVMTGGPTAGPVSEAGMMALIAMSRGIKRSRIILEEKARSTHQNAAFAAKLLARRRVGEVTVISKKSHLEWALPIFRRWPLFRGARGLECDVEDKEVVAQMRAYLKARDNFRVKRRLEGMLKGHKGTD